jgi:predicted transcriptional regulator
MPDIDQSKALLGFTVQIVSAHVKNNPVPTAHLPALIQQVHAALANAGGPPRVVEPEKPAPSVAPKKSIFPDYLVCLEDGRKMKTLKRYLRSTYNMSPEQYREKWDLAPDYPMVAPNYATRRSDLAKQIGLGRKTVEAPAVSSPPPETYTIFTPPPKPVVQAAPIVAAPPAPREPRRAEHTADSVFANFTKSERAPEVTDEAEAPAAGAQAAPGPARSTRKPFSKQLARGMRP